MGSLPGLHAAGLNHSSLGSCSDVWILRFKLFTLILLKLSAYKPMVHNIIITSESAGDQNFWRVVRFSVPSKSLLSSSA